MRFVPLLWSNLKRRKIRTVCTGLSILVAFLLIGALLSLRTGFSRRVDLAGADRLVVSQKTAVNQPMPLAYRDRLAEIPGVAAVTYLAAFRGVYQDPRNAFTQLAVDADTWFEMYRDLWVAPDDQLARWKRNRTGALIGQELADRFGWKIGDRIPLQSTTSPRPGGGAWEFTVDGIYQAGPTGMGGSDLMFFQYAYLNETRTLGRDLVDSYRVRVIDPRRANEVAQQIDARFANSAFETRTSTENAFVRAIAEQVGDVGAIIIAIMGPVLFTIILVCGNSMAQSIRERTNELAVLKTLGFTEGRILVLVLAESFVLPVLAGGIGLAAWVLIQRANPMAGALPMPPLSLSNIASAP
jgi:putative ABC transport system permease protein